VILLREIDGRVLRPRCPNHHGQDLDEIVAIDASVRASLATPVVVV